jgi:hypothetical protein
MPKRTTEFQKLVYLVRKHCASGSTVTESKPLTDSATGEEREVDIYIESIVDGLPVRISIECTECARPSTVEWVERMIGKHQDLPTDVLYLFSRNGFTEPAIEKAKRYRKRVVTLEALGDESAERLLNGTTLLSFKITSQKTTKVPIGLEASGKPPAQQVNVFTDTLIYNQSGEAGKLADATVAWGTVPYEGKHALIVASKDESGVTKDPNLK